MHFHIFKKNIKKYNSFCNFVSNQKLYLKLETYLNDRVKKNLSVVTNSRRDIIIRSETNIPEETECHNDETSPKRKRKTEMPAKFAEFKMDLSKENEDIRSMENANESRSSVVNDSVLENSSAVKKKSLWNTNSELTEEQKEWIRKEVLKSETTICEKGTQKNVWKCSQCSSTVKNSWILRKHLRDVHLLKMKYESEEKTQRREFMMEVRNSKIETTLDDGTSEVFWKCQRCEKILKSESGFIKHLQFSHIKATLVDPNFVAQCKIEVEYDDGRPSEFAWACPACTKNQKVFKTATGIKNHFKLEHSDIDFGGEQYKKKIEEIQMRTTAIKDEEKHCEILLQTEKGVKNIWRCSRCQELRYFRSENGFKAHMKHFHFQNRSVDEQKVDSCRMSIEEDGKLRKIWKCSECLKIVKTKDGFISHVVSEHPAVFHLIDDYQSQPMADTFPANFINDESSLKTLTEQVMNERGIIKIDGYKKSCSTCGLFFKHHYKTHLECHKTFKQLAPSLHLPKCDQCKIVFGNHEAHQTHITTHSDSVKALAIYPSDGLAYFGGKKFKEPSGTADNAVDEASPFKCGHCLAMFWEESECITHQMMLHINPLICPIDLLEFSGSRGMTLFNFHMKNKHPELFPDLKYNCTYCHEEFSTIFQKLNHMKNSCDEKKLNCDGCGKRFFSKVKLAHHLRTEKGLLKYECEICQKRCLNSMDLKIHQRCHDDSRPYPCSLCPSAFKTSAARSSHMEIHSDTNLSCQICGKTFKKRTVLARHIKLMHDKPYR